MFSQLSNKLINRCAFPYQQITAMMRWLLPPLLFTIILQASHFPKDPQVGNLEKHHRSTILETRVDLFLGLLLALELKSKGNIIGSICWSHLAIMPTWSPSRPTGQHHGHHGYGNPWFFQLENGNAPLMASEPCPTESLWPFQ